MITRTVIVGPSKEVNAKSPYGKHVIMAGRKARSQPPKAQARLTQQEQRAKALTGEDRADALWRVWLDARDDADLIRGHWSAGRDAAFELLDGSRRAEGCVRLASLIDTLCERHFISEAARCLAKHLPRLTPKEVADVLHTTNVDQQLLKALSPEGRAMLREKIEIAEREAFNPSLPLVHGHLLLLDDSPSIATRSSPLAARRLEFERSSGSYTAKGVGYEAHYALARLLTDPTIVGVRTQGLEDVDLYREGTSIPIPHVRIQAKTSETPWTIGAMQSRTTGGNHVFDTFASALIADPDAEFIFSSNIGMAPKALPLRRLADRLRVVVQDSDLAGMGIGEEEAWNALQEAMDPTLLEQISLDRLLARIQFDLPRTEQELRSETISHLSTLLNVNYAAAESTYRMFVGLLLEAMAERRYIPRTEIEEMARKAALQAQAWRGIGSELVEAFALPTTSGATAAEYHEGRISVIRAVAADFDIVDPTLLEKVGRALAEAGCCIILAPSGQGKTTLLYRYACSVSEERLVVRIHRLCHAAVAQLQSFLQTDLRPRVLVIVDDLQPNEVEWPSALERLLDLERLEVLATS
ncbi:MAG: hypothetical protein ACRDIE_21570, partial [Chloroflexota bacterium]